MKIKTVLCSMGIACLLSVPVLHFSVKSWSQTPEITIKCDYDITAYDQALENMKRIAEQNAEREILKQELIQAELNRESRRIEQYIEAKEVLEMYQVDVPEDVQRFCEEAQEETNVCAELLEAVCWQESRFKADVESQGCYGIMQISTKWHKNRMKDLGVTDIFDTRSNIRVGADYLAELFEKHEGDLYDVLMEYNGDTREGVSEYAIEICEIAEALERVHGK